MEEEAHRKHLCQRGSSMYGSVTPENCCWHYPPGMCDATLVPTDPKQLVVAAAMGGRVMRETFWPRQYGFLPDRANTPVYHIVAATPVRFPPSYPLLLSRNSFLWWFTCSCRSLWVAPAPINAALVPWYIDSALGRMEIQWLYPFAFILWMPKVDSAGRWPWHF